MEKYQSQYTFRGCSVYKGISRKLFTTAVFVKTTLVRNDSDSSEVRELYFFGMEKHQSQYTFRGCSVYKGISRKSFITAVSVKTTLVHNDSDSSEVRELYFFGMEKYQSQYRFRGLVFI